MIAGSVRCLVIVDVFYSSDATIYVKSIYSLLSCLNTHRASSCRTNRPAIPHNACMTRSSIASRSSLLGPNQTSQRFSMVKLVDSIISPLLFFSNLSKGSGNLASRSINRNIGLEGGCCHCVTDGSKRPLRGLNRGRRCLGQGMRRKSCGAE